MEIIGSNTDSAIARMLDSHEHPVTLVNPDYRINVFTIRMPALAECLGVSAAAVTSPDMSLKAMERRHLGQLMRAHRDDKEKVAAIAGISVRSLYRKLQEAEHGT